MHFYFIASGAYFNEICCDSLKQISFFYPFLERMFEQGDFFWSWNYGLGGDVFGQFLYYFSTSLFFWLTILFFDIETLQDIFELRLFISIAKLTLTMVFTYHLFQYLKRSTLSSIIGCLIYGGAVYFTFYSLRYDFMVDGMVWLPLLLLGFEKFAKERKKGLFIFTIFLVVSSNFYLAFINSIYLGLYVIFKYFILREKYTIKDFLVYFIRFSALYLVGFLLASFAFFPAVYNYLHVDRFYYEIDLPLLFSGEFYKALPYRLFFMSETLRMVIILPVLTLFVFLYGFFVRKKESKLVFIFSLVIVAMFLVPITYSMFNGFSSIQYRWLYLFVFMLAYVVTYILDEMLDTYRKIDIFFFGAILVLLATVVKLKYEVFEVWADDNDLILLGIAAVICLLLIFRTKIPRVVFSIGLISTVLLNTIFINNLVLQAFLDDPEKLKEQQQVIVNSSNYGIAAEHDMFNELKRADSSFYRIIWNNQVEFNAPLLYNYNGFSAYNSLLSGDVHQFLKREYNTMQYNSPSLYKNLDNRLFLETVLGNKYYIIPEKNSLKPYGYSLYKQLNDYTIYQNDFTLPIGFMYDSILDKNTFAKLTYSEKDQLLLRAAVVLDAPSLDLPVFDLEDLDAVTKNIQLENLDLNNAVLEDRKLSVKQYNQIILPDIIPEQDGEILLEINIKRPDGERYIMDANQKTFQYFGDNNIYNYPKEQIVINLGNQHKSSDIKIGLTPGEYLLGEINVHFNPYETYEDLVKRKRAQSMQNITYTNESVSGQVDVQEKGILFLSIPYSEGWKVKVDGESVDTIKTNSAFIGVPLSEGLHKVELRFVTPYFYPGLWISITTLFVFSAILLWRKRKKLTTKE